MGNKEALTATNCLIPVSENEERALKAMQRRNEAAEQVDEPQTKEAETMRASPRLRPLFPTFVIGGAKKDSNMLLSNGQVSAFSHDRNSKLKDRLNLPDLSYALNQDITTIKSDATTSGTGKTPNPIQSFREMKLPDAPKTEMLPAKQGLPMRDSPSKVLASQKLMMNFTKYKQLKRFNDSLVRIQQKIVHDLHAHMT
jgi:hypothetical protein